MSDVAQTADGVHLMPWERGGETLNEAGARGRLFDLLGSEEEPAEQDEPVASEEEASEAEEQETEEVEASEEDEEDGEELEESEEEDSEAEKPVKTNLHKVKVDGEEVEVEYDELLKGYSRTADYTRKTQEIATQRKALEGETTQFRAAREQYEGVVGALLERLEAMKPAEPDWDTLRKENPAEYAALRADFDRIEKDRDALRAEQARLAAEKQMEEVQTLQQHLEAEVAKLAEAIPEWKDQAKAAQEKRALADYAKGMGYTDDDLGRVADHRIMVMLRKAWQYDQIKAKGKTLTEKATDPPPVLKPGGKTGEDPKRVSHRKQLQNARSKLARTGRTDDAVAAILLLNDD